MKNTRLYRYIYNKLIKEERLDYGRDDIVCRISRLFGRLTQIHYVYLPPYSNALNKELINWLENIDHIDLEKEFSYHEIIELLIEEES